MRIECQALEKGLGITRYNVQMEKHLRMARILTKLLDNQFSFLGIKFGLDPIMDLIPGLGDIAGAVLSLYLVWIALRMKVPEKHVWKMLRNILIDFLLGLTPFAGSIADVFFKSNVMNLKILEKNSTDVIEGEIY